MAQFPTFVGGSYRSQSPISDQEALKNWYIEVMEQPGATSRASLYPTPGVEAFAESLSTGWRALFSDDNSGRVFGVVGTSFVEVLAAGTITVRGAVAVDANPATISTNGDGGGQLLITSGGNAYCYDLATNTLTTELSGTATMGAVLYGYGLVFDVATGTVYLSDLFDLTTWDPTQFFQRSINSDPWQAMFVTPYGYIVLPGTQTGETWYNAGTFPIPFAPDPSGQYARGIAAPFSMAQLGDTVVWLSRGIEGDFQVVRQVGFTPQRISTHPIELLLAGYNDNYQIADAIGQVYGSHGHLFYLLTLPSANNTLCFDAVTVGKANPWHERGTWIAEDNAFIYWRPVFHAFAFGKHLMGDLNSGVLYEMQHNFPLDVDGRPIRRMRRSPAIISQHERIILDELEILMQTGVGTGSGQGENPVVMLRVSKDGGYTWGSERPAILGAMGQYWVRVRFLNLGQARSFVFELTVTDPVVATVTDAYLWPRGQRRAA